MADFGHVKISRKAYESDPYWLEKREFSKWEAWEWLIQSAAWRPYKKATKRAGVQQLERGETPPLSERFLGDVWGWRTRGRIQRFLSELCQLGRIKTGKRTSDGTTYLLVNYDLYQETRTSKRTSNRPQADIEQTKIEAVKQTKGGSAKAHPIPSDWKPTAEHVRYCAEHRIDIDFEAERFKLHAEQKAVRNVSWNAAFSGWIRKDWVKHLNGNGKPKFAPIIEDD